MGRTKKYALDDSEILRLLGLITVEFSYLEADLSYVVSRFQGLKIRSKKDLGNMVSDKLSFRMKIGVLNDLYIFRKGEKLPNKVRKSLDGCENTRNRFTHSYYYYTKNGKKIVNLGYYSNQDKFVNNKIDKSRKGKEITPTLLNNFVEKIKNTRKELGELTY